jgi:hypothetical protein
MKDGRNKPRWKVMVHFMMHWMGLPIPGSFLVFPPPIPSLISLISPIPPIEYKLAHIPLERRGTGVAAVCFAHPGVLVVEPTSLIRGEGLITALWDMVGTELGVEGGWWWWRRNEPISTVM